ncbi:MAG: PEP-CTERM sorting domain-containing protein [Cognaticolwellia sp.]|jgi:hypothetical protein
MSSKIINIFLVCLFSLSVVKTVSADLIVGNQYSDSDGIQWEYLGSVDLADGPAQAIKPKTYNGFEIANLFFSAQIGNSEIALSSNDYFDYLFFNNNDIAGFVNHLANYDSFGSNGQLVELAGDVITDNAGGLGYDAVGDISAFVNDRAAQDFYMNHVFKAVTASVSVPEPSTIAIFSLALVGLMSRRLKNQ